MQGGTCSGCETAQSDPSTPKSDLVCFTAGINRGRMLLFSDNTHHLKGTQVVLREGYDGRLLVVCHSFDEPYRGDIEIELKNSRLNLVDSFGSCCLYDISMKKLIIPVMKEKHGYALLFETDK